MRREVEKCRRSLRKRTHTRFICCTSLIVVATIFVVSRTISWSSSSSEEKEYNILLNTLKKVKGIGKSSLLFVDKSEYIFADEQPDTSEIQNGLAIKPRTVGSNETTKTTTSTTESKAKGVPKKSEDNAIEHDPSIDENIVPETYKWHLNVERSTKCTKEKPAKHALLLRSHRTGSHTLGNIFYRYGDLNNLFFALPKTPDFQHYWPLRFHHTRVDKSLLGKEPPNFLINTARNNRIKIKTFLSTETYKIAVMRDPANHLESVFDSSRLRSHLPDENEDRFQEFVVNPGKFVNKVKNKTKAFDPVFYLMHNGQLFDFGYNVEDFMVENPVGPVDIRFALSDLSEYLDLVLITEYMDESLVLLQRLLCWDLSDVTYIKMKARKDRINVTQPQQLRMREWNHLDSILYQHFNETLWKKIAEQDETFWNDVKKLKTMNKNLMVQCVNQNASTNETSFHNQTKSSAPPPANEYTPVLKDNVEPNIKHICERLLLPEADYVHFLKLKQKGNLEQENKRTNEKILFRNTTEGQFYYNFLKSISLEQTGGDNRTVVVKDEDEKPLEEPEEEIVLGMSHTD